MRIVSIMVCIAVLAGAALAQAPSGNTVAEEMRKDALKVYIDGFTPDIEYVKTEIPFVNFVRDKFDADIHVIITSLSTGSGGTEYTLNFIGREQYSPINDTLQYYTQEYFTADESRRGITNSLKAGILRFLVGTPYIDHVTIGYDLEAVPEAARDKWDYWTFSVSPSFEIRQHRETTEKTRTLRSGLSFYATRVTESSKTSLYLVDYYNDYKFTHYFNIPGNDVSKSYRNEIYSRGSRVFSLGEHFSAGAFGSSEYQRFGNSFSHSWILTNQIGPKIEYDLFPYAEFTSRRVYLDYFVSAEFQKSRDEGPYFDITDSEWNYLEEIDINCRLIQPWGSLYGYIYFFHNLKDINNNRITWSTSLSYRINRYLNISLTGYGYRYQYPSPNKRIQYSNRLTVGLTYTFGNIYSNVVNPRMSY